MVDISNAIITGEVAYSPEDRPGPGLGAEVGAGGACGSRTISPLLQDLFTRLFQKDPAKRITLAVRRGRGGAGLRPTNA